MKAPKKRKNYRGPVKLHDSSVAKYLISTTNLNWLFNTLHRFMNYDASDGGIQAINVIGFQSESALNIRITDQCPQMTLLC